MGKGQFGRSLLTLVADREGEGREVRLSRLRPLLMRRGKLSLLRRARPSPGPLFYRLEWDPAIGIGTSPTISWNRVPSREQPDAVERRIRGLANQDG